MSICATILAEQTSVEFSPAVLGPEGMTLTAPMSTDYKENDEINSKDNINFLIVVNSHMFA